MEVLGVIGEAIGSVAFWWGIVQVAKIVSITYLISECEVPFERVSDFYKRPQKRGF